MSKTSEKAPFYLFVHSDHPLDPLGPNSGAEMATLNEARYLAASGRRVCVAGILRQPVSFDRGVQFVDLGASYDVEAALDYADQQGPYVVLAAGRAFALLLSRRRKLCIKRVFITHDRCAGDSGFKPSVLDRHCDKILAASIAQKDKLVSEGAPEEKMLVIRYGVDFSIFWPSPAEQHSPRRLVFAGALVPDKGVHLLITAFANLKQRYTDLELEIFGSSSLWSRGDYLDIPALSAALPGLTFHGKSQQSAIADGFRRSALCVVPSIWFDPYPLTSLEAQACGAPVVTFRMGGLPEGVVQGETGLVVEDVSAEALTAGLDSLLRDPALLRRMSANAAQRAAVTCRWEDVIQKIIDVCECPPLHSEEVGRIPTESLGVYGSLAGLLG
jgi:glycosyltransferase involved in cell wall biosynthesis